MEHLHTPDLILKTYDAKFTTNSITWKDLSTQKDNLLSTQKRVLTIDGKQELIREVYEFTGHVPRDATRRYYSIENALCSSNIVVKMLYFIIWLFRFNLFIYRSSYSLHYAEASYEFVRPITASLHLRNAAPSEEMLQR